MTVYRKKDEGFEGLMGRFQGMVRVSRILADLARHAFYRKPSEERRRKKRIKAFKSRGMAGRNRGRKRGQSTRGGKT